MKKLTLALAAVVIAASTTASIAKWTKIGPGPSYDAEAQSSLKAMGAKTGTFAFGSPSFVVGAAIGCAIRTSIVKQH